ncbi:hypothetical protein EYF80_006368 [Liparis tanakae]|uniref:Uncharacterized protein n=1 Tax=Liparis tanakae TaxID=230148 RepID=A0A4Z2J051_9TELE|nr:hypothetical protein EYF80_006368 [Liparis tanakae]
MRAAAEYLHSESGDPLAAGLSQWAVGVCTAGHTGYMSLDVAGLDACPLSLYRSPNCFFLFEPPPSSSPLLPPSSSNLQQASLEAERSGRLALGAGRGAEDRAALQLGAHGFGVAAVVAGAGAVRRLVPEELGDGGVATTGAPRTTPPQADGENNEPEGPKRRRIGRSVSPLTPPSLHMQSTLSS